MTSDEKLSKLQQMMSDMDNDSPVSDEETPEPNDQIFDIEMDKRSPLMKGLSKKQPQFSGTPMKLFNETSLEPQTQIKPPVEIHIVPSLTKTDSMKTIVELPVPNIVLSNAKTDSLQEVAPIVENVDGKQRSLSTEQRKISGSPEPNENGEKRKSNASTLSGSFRYRALSFSPTKVRITSESSKDIVAKATNVEDYDELDVKNMIAQYVLKPEDSYQYLSIFNENFSLDDETDQLSFVKLETNASMDSEDEVSEVHVLSQSDPLQKPPQPSPIGQMVAGGTPIPSPSKSSTDLQKDREAYLLAKATSIIHMENLVNVESYFTQEKRKSLGEPLVIRASIAYLAIGTSRGIIVLFMNDGKIIPLSCPCEKSALTSMDAHASGEYLISGYSNGGICLWNTSSLEITKLVPNEFQSPVESISFLNAQKIIACARTGIKTISFSKVLFSIYAEAATLNGYSNVEHVTVLIPTKDPILTNQYEIVAISSEHYFHVVIMNPFRVVFKLDRPKDISDNALCYCDWRSAYIPRDSGIPRNALLAISWGHHLYFYRIIATKEEIRVVKVLFLDMNSEIVGIGWNGEQVVSVVDTFQGLTIVDPFTAQIVDSLQMKNTRLMSHQRFDVVHDKKGIPRPCYTDSVCMRNGQMILLGAKEIRTIRAYSWKERLDNHIYHGEWEKALNLALDFYLGKGVAIIMLPNDNNKRETLLRTTISMMLESYIDTFTDKQPNIPFVLKMSIEINNSHSVIDTLMKRFIGREQTVLVHLEPFILDGSIKRVSQTVLEHFFRLHHHSSDTLEKVLLKLDISDNDEKWLNLNCKQYNMYGALFYLANVFKNDYTSPIRSLLDMVKASTKYENMLFDYLKRCLSSIPEIRKIIVSFVFKTVDSKAIGPARYPILFQLLSVNATQFLSLLEVVFRDVSPKCIWNQKDLSRQDLFNSVIDLFDFKMSPFHTWEIGKKIWPTLRIVFEVFSFFLEFLANKMISVTQEMIHRIFAVYGSEAYIERKGDQEMLLSLLGLYNNLDLDKILSICEKSHFFRVALAIYEKKLLWQKALLCHLNDPILRTRVFDYIPNILSQEGIQNAILTNLSSFIKLDPEKTAKLIIQHFDEVKVLNLLEPFPKLQFDYLKSLIGDGATSEMTKLLEMKGFRVDQDLNYRFLFLLAQFEPQSAYPFLANQKVYDVDKCLALTKKYKIADATSFLLERMGQIVEALDIYLVNLAEKFKVLKIKLMQESKVLDPQNKQYSHLDSFYFINREICHPNLPKVKMVKMLPKIGGSIDLRELPEYKSFLLDLKHAVRMCQRNSDNGTISEDDIEMIWFHLVDSLIMQARDLRLGYHGKRVMIKSKKMIHSDTDSLSDGNISDEEKDDEVSLEQNMKDHNDMLKRKLAAKDSLLKELSWESNEEKINKTKGQIKQVEIQIAAIRSVLEQLRLDQIKAQEEEEMKLKDPLDAANIPKLCNLWLQLSLGDFIKFTLNSMIGYLDTSTIMLTVTKKYKQVEAGHFKDAMLNLIEKSNYETMIHQSIKTLLNKDAYWLFTSFFQENKKGLKQKWKYCQVCSNSLWEEDDDGIKMYGCGHSFHARCLETIEVCPICYKQELKEKKEIKEQKAGNEVVAIPQGKLSKYYRMEKELSASGDFLRNYSEDVIYTTTILNVGVVSPFKPTQSVFRRDMKALPPKATNFGEIEDFADLLE